MLCGQPYHTTAPTDFLYTFRKCRDLTLNYPLLKELPNKDMQTLYGENEPRNSCQKENPERPRPCDKCSKTSLSYSLHWCCPFGWCPEEQPCLSPASGWPCQTFLFHRSFEWWGDIPSQLCFGLCGDIEPEPGKKEGQTHHLTRYMTVALGLYWLSGQLSQSCYTGLVSEHNLLRCQLSPLSPFFTHS